MIYGDHSQGSAGTAKRLIIGKISNSESLSDSSTPFALHDLNATLRVIPGAVDMHALRVDYFNANEPPTCGPTTSSSISHANRIPWAHTGSSARMVTQTDTKDTVFTATSNEYTGDGQGSGGSDAAHHGRFHNTSSDGTMAIVGRNGFPIVPSLYRLLPNNWHNGGKGRANVRKQALQWFEKKYNPYDYEIGTMIFAEFHEGTTNHVYPYLLILGTDNGGGVDKKWRFLPMWHKHVINGDEFTNTDQVYGVPTVEYWWP
jgi:hypothetical protein